MAETRLRFCTVRREDWGCTTTFQDGTSIGAHPHFDDKHYSVISHRVGLGDDLMAYCVSHDVLHSFTEEWLHGRPSRVLWALAHGRQLPGTESIYEELAVQTAQRWVFANERPLVAGTDWDAFRDAAWRALEPLRGE